MPVIPLTAPTETLTTFLPRFLINNPVYDNPAARVLLFSLGAAYTFQKLISFGSHLLLPVFYSSRKINNRYGEGSWVLITGASDGIGEAFVMEFASRGFNVILLGRNKEKLEGVEKKCKKEHPNVQTRVLVYDLKNCYEEGFVENMFKDVYDLDISILINNAGQMIKGPYYEANIEEIRDQVIVNCLAPSLITRVLLPKLKQRKNKSAVIFLSSKVATFPRPFQQLYGSTKSYNEYLARGLSYEYPDVDIIALKPGKVKTEMTDYRDKDMKTIKPEEFVKVSLTYLGKTNHTYGHVKHRWHSWVTDIIPESLRIYYFQARYPELK